MSIKGHKLRIWSVVTVIACALLVVLMLTQVALALPPRPEPEPPPQPEPPQPEPPKPAAKPAPIEGYIELCVHFPKTWPWDEVHWQELWTIVQWQGEWGIWHQVEGWQGTLDYVEVGEDGNVVGKKVWWVKKADFGSGPFRWAIYQGEDGDLLAASDAFDLPDFDGETVVVEITLAP
jgi:hypothetical protein